jgi:hypothetical protein
MAIRKEINYRQLGDAGKELLNKLHNLAFEKMGGDQARLNVGMEGYW